MRTRRDWIATTGLTAVAGALGTGTLSRSRARADAPAPSPVAAPVDAAWALAPLDAGSPLVDGWSFAGMDPVTDGRAAIHMRHASGATAVVHLCRRNPAHERGLASTRHFDLVLMNGAQGDTTTPEGVGRATLALARRIAANEPGASSAALEAFSTHHEPPKPSPT